jgi:diguanylate cyclase (GGDEF)-like protein
VYRVGGDEFVVVAFDLDAAGSARLQERLELASGAGSRRKGDAPVKLQLSVGIACGAGRQQSAGELLAGADRAMYERRIARKQLNSEP